MLRKSSWRLEHLKCLISVNREHVPLHHTVHEEDPKQHLDHLHKVEAEEILALANKGDKAMEDDVVVDRTVVVEAAKVIRNRPELAYSVSTMASMDTMLCSVLEEPAHLVAVVLLHL